MGGFMCCTTSENNNDQSSKDEHLNMKASSLLKLDDIDFKLYQLQQETLINETKDMEQFEYEQECPICQCDIIMPFKLDCRCKFTYCLICIQEWIYKHNECPFCRYTIQ